MHLFGARLDRGRSNAVVGWILIGVVALAAVESVLTRAYLWGGFTALVVVASVVPAVESRDWTATVPWPILLPASLAVAVRSLGYYPETSGYVALASLALLLVTELDGFTHVEMSRRFGVAFAVLTTMAIQGLWTVAQFYSDAWLGTAFLRSQTELQWDFVIVTVVGLALGAAAQIFFTAPQTRKQWLQLGEESGR